MEGHRGGDGHVRDPTGAAARDPMPGSAAGARMAGGRLPMVLAYPWAMTYTLVLLRHGESDWNAKNLFTGWVDVPLTEKGEAEAIAGGELMKERSEEHTTELH